MSRVYRRAHREMRKYLRLFPDATAEEIAALWQWVKEGNQYTYGNYEGKVDKPQNFDEMCRIATVLSQGFNHVRVDLYNVDGKIYFGEMTFTNGSGLEKITPKEYDVMLGNMLKLPEKS